MNNSISSKNVVTVSYNAVKPSKSWNLKKGGGGGYSSKTKRKTDLFTSSAQMW